jgi:two-component system, sensor histidine kinase and response regulator
MTTKQTFKGDILIVDDTPDNLRFLSMMLTEQGYDVRSVKNGAMALIGVRAQPPDLILLDITMPGMDGYEVCQHLKADPNTQAIPIIFISALAEVLDKVKAFSVGGVDYITKPFRVAEVLARIENQLTIRRLQAQLMQALEHEQALNQRIEAMATLEERHRIARDIHDSLGHLLVVLNIQIEAALALWQDDPAQGFTFLTEAKRLGTQSLAAVRQSVSDMRADPLQGQLLDKAIATLIQEFHQATGISVESQIDLSHPVSNQVNLVVYRIVQEGLTNICKYAEATAVKLHIQTTPDKLSLVLQDNGKGFCLEDTPSGFGFQGMQERIIAVGGYMEVQSAPAAGCQITATFHQG